MSIELENHAAEARTDAKGGERGESSNDTAKSRLARMVD